MMLCPLSLDASATERRCGAGRGDAEREAGLTVEQEWKLVARAGELHLPQVQRLRDPDCGAAHAFLGHKRRNKRWRWVIGKHEGAKEELDKLVSKGSDRVSLRSEHFVVETSTGLRNAVNLVTCSCGPNVALTHYREGDDFPVDLFDIARQQLLYSTTVTPCERIAALGAEPGATEKGGSGC